MNGSFIHLTASVGYEFLGSTSLILKGALPLLGQSFAQTQIVELQLEWKLSSEPPLTRSKKISPHSSTFITHETIEARITAINDAFDRVQINKGTLDQVQNGDSFDILSTDDPKQLVARGAVIEVTGNSSLLKITHYFQERLIEVGWTARRRIQPH